LGPGVGGPPAPHPLVTGALLYDAGMACLDTWGEIYFFGAFWEPGWGFVHTHPAPESV
jgi:hypothetical protein